MIVVFDTNVWLSELGLRSPTAAAARFCLKHQGARIAVPEVVRLEVEQNLTSRLLEHIDGIRSAHRQLLTVFGSLREIVLPSEESIREKVLELLASMQVEQIDVPFCIESARSSFFKTIRKHAPSHQSQQFKDGVIWADCLSLLAQDEVVLVTADKAFYQDQIYARGLHTSLQSEAAGFPNRIRVLPAVADLLDAVKVPISIDADALQAAFSQQFERSVFGSIEHHGFALGSRSGCVYKVYATEDPALLFLDFSIDIRCIDARGEGRFDAMLKLRGDGSYAPSTRSFINLRSFGEHLVFSMADGTRGEIRNAVAYGAGLSIGNRQVSSIVRVALPVDEA